jgi:uncharacterized protein (DUF433 family)
MLGMGKTAAISTEKSHISSTPGVCGGRPCITGTRIRVQDIYAWHELQGESPDEIVARFPQISLADVYAALAYYWDNRDAFVHDLEEEGRVVEEMKKKIPSKLDKKLKAIKTDGNSVSS